MKGITVEYIGKDTEEYRIVKKRGKLTLDDIQDALAEKGLSGVAVLSLTVGMDYDSGWPEESEGDAVKVVLTGGESDCPFCRRLLPPIVYCPHCYRKTKLREDWKEGEE